MIKLVNFIVKFVIFWLLVNLICVYLQIYQINNNNFMAKLKLNEEQKQFDEDLTTFWSRHNPENIEKDFINCTTTTIAIATRFNTALCDYIVGQNIPYHIKNESFNAFIKGYPTLTRHVKAGCDSITIKLLDNWPGLYIQAVQWDILYDNEGAEGDEHHEYRQRVEEAAVNLGYDSFKDLFLGMFHTNFIYIYQTLHNA